MWRRFWLLIFAWFLVVTGAYAASPVWFAEAGGGCAGGSNKVTGSTQLEACAAAYTVVLAVMNNGCSIPTHQTSLNGCGVDGVNDSGTGWHYQIPTWQACQDGTPPDSQGQCAAEPEKCPMYDGTDKTTQAKPSNCQCPSGTEWQPFTGCRKKCEIPANQEIVSTSSYVIPKFTSSADAPCVGNCQVFASEGGTVLKNGSVLGGATSTGWACAGTGEGTAQRSPAPKDTTPVDETKIHDPVCADGEGVGTSASGKVLCIPPGTPDTSTPVVKKSTKTETFSDNTTKTTTEVITIDPNTSASSTVTIVIGTGGQSGTGTTTSVRNESGSGGTSGNGSGEGSCDPTKDFCGGPGTSGLYTKKTKTVAGVVGDFKNGVMSSGIGSAATGFFNVTTPSGGCPNWVVEVPYLNVTLNVSQYFCTAAAISMMNLVGAVLLFVASFVGFRWAIL